MLAEQYVPLKYCGVWCKMGIRYHTSYCNTYFLVCTIPKILTKFSSGIGMVIRVALPGSQRKALCST
jgi:hypothetical protein